MPLRTTLVGALPKADFSPKLVGHNAFSVKPAYAEEIGRFLAKFDVGGYFEVQTLQAVLQQVELGLDILTEGELSRVDYWRYNCFYFDGLETDGAEIVVSGPVSLNEPVLHHDFSRAQAYTERPVKVAMAGPATLLDPTHLQDRHYGDRKRLHFDLAQALNGEVRALAEAGCRWIQLDEPMLGFDTEMALDYGIEALDVCFEGVGDEVNRVVHICRGYAIVDGDRSVRNPINPYPVLAAALERSAATVVALEAAAEGFDYELLETFATTAVMLGFIANVSSAIEQPDDIRREMLAALEHIDAERLIAASDCGFANFRGVDATIVWRKIRNMVEAAGSVG